jgi:recombinational DNA repair protein (RecF pathway)
MNDPAIQNLDYLRQLIAEVRGEDPYLDMLRLRMMQDTGMGVDNTVEEG